MELELDMLSLRYERLRRHEPRREKRLLASIAEDGQRFPILVIEAEETFVVLAGYKRVRAPRKLGRETIRAARWELSEPEAVMVEGLMRSSGGEIRSARPRTRGADDSFECAGELLPPESRRGEG